MKKIVTIPFFSIFYLFASSQNEANNWLFGAECWLDFSPGHPVANLNNPNWFLSGSASMSDKDGNLLFSSDGVTVYNRLNKPMPNGTGLLNIATNAMRPIITVPQPGSESKYYLFYVENWWAANGIPRLRYATIDMTLQNGLGDVVEKNQLLLDGQLVALKITAALHCNKKDIWVIGHLFNSDKYFAYLITENGISTEPVYSTGIDVDRTVTHSFMGHMKVSPAGDKVATCWMGLEDKVELTDFNSQTGEITNSKLLTIRPSYANNNGRDYLTGPTGVEFSPSGTYLYVSGVYDVRYFDDVSYMTGHIFQFNTTSNTEAQIQSSRVFLDSIVNDNYESVQLANDGKIYTTTLIEYLSVINEPEADGLASNFVRKQTFLGPGRRPRHQLPMFLQSFLRFPVIANGNCQFQNINFSIKNLSGVSGVEWNFGDLASGNNNISHSLTPTHIFSSEGQYTVKAVLTNSNGCGVDTIYKTVHAGPFKVFLGNDTILCKGDSLKLRMSIPGGKNNWSTNSADTVIYINTAGKYWVNVGLGECMASDTIEVQLKDKPVFSLGRDTTVCDGDVISIATGKSYPNANYLWSEGSNGSAIQVSKSNTYWLSLKDEYGCSFSDSIEVNFKNRPVFNLGKDTMLCQNNSFTLGVNLSDVPNVLWSTDEVTKSIRPFQSGLYWAEVTKDGCNYRDSIEVNYKPIPVVNLGLDTTLCNGHLLILDAGNNNALYEWQDGSVDKTFSVNKPGFYSVKVSQDECSSNDTILVQYKDAPVFDIGPDFSICSNETIVLKPSVANNNNWLYSWQNQSNALTFIVHEPGVYWLKVSNECGYKTDTVMVSKGICNIYVPNAFTPNGDGLNDLFKVGGREELKDFKMNVYNRWGQLVFETRQPNQGWNGYYNNVLQPIGNYVWIIQFKDRKDNKEEMRGSVVLLQ